MVVARLTGVPRADDESGEVSYTVMPDGEVVWPKRN
jgi:hypothetical protein